MKKLIVIFMLISAVSVSGQQIQELILGTWSMDSTLIEMEDGLLVSTEADYSYPYLGISNLNFLDSGFVVISTRAGDYRAFYEISELDFDNYHINCSFRDGEEFLLKLVREGDSWSYLYRIAEDSVLKGDTVDEKSVIDIDLNSFLDEEAELEMSYSLYTGIMNRTEGGR
ncbi:MAG: hypothetical protein PQJ61_07560 [Spirochaetales bacterium]|uniref:Lipocalin-like domain-containing protein n=1 Tax=Candidatus Thalassospirochaeta sargassi TaxID=3119039 RepID=A0AAJ1MKA2_9SPIO|nr:hypothetical protein [Spirochaetales bacterium]